MKRIILFILTFILSNLFQILCYAENNVISVSADSAILICADSGIPIFSKNDKEKKSMASTTKIMTALLALEYAESDNKDITITDEMVKTEGSSMGLLPGYIVSIENIVKGMMMCSGNDAANTLAISVSKSINDFCDLMNERAKQIGMVDTNFVTPSGLDDDNHYSTAYDMAILGSYALQNNKFADIVSQSSIKVNFINPKENRTYKNHNRLITSYNWCKGIKTGFTKKSGRCLVSCAEKDGCKLIAVTLNAPNDWEDHKNLFEYGFSKVKSVTLDDEFTRFSVKVVGALDEEITVNGNKTTVTLPISKENEIERFVELPHFEYAPVYKGQSIGRVIYKIDGKIIGINNLTSTKNEELIKIKKNLLNRILGIFKF